jgi:hypothetical protein
MSGAATAARAGKQRQRLQQAEVVATAPAVATDLRVNKDTRHRQLISRQTKSQMPRNIANALHASRKTFGRPN